MNEAELMTFAEMAATVRKKFETDKKILMASENVATDVQALGEIKRTMRMKRRLARRKNTIHNTFVCKGFEGK